MWERLCKKLAYFLEELEQALADLIYDRVSGFWPSIAGILLGLLSYVFGGLVGLRHLLYRWGFLQQHCLGAFVIVVGNLSVGGTGKTPVVEYLAAALQKQGRRVAILSRGYKAQRPAFWRRWWQSWVLQQSEAVRVVSDGQHLVLDSASAGDEPYMLAKNLPGVVVLVDKDRIRSGTLAIERFGADTLILDDGLQYLRLKSQARLVLIDSTNPFGNRYLLPRGILREPIAYLKRATCVLVTKSDGTVAPALREEIRQHHPTVPIIPCQHRPEGLIELGQSSAQLLPLNFLAGKQVAALSGIARPESFEAFLVRFGAQILLSNRFTDHHPFTETEMALFCKTLTQWPVDCVITTEKDAVRIPSSVHFPVPVYYLRLKVHIPPGHDTLRYLWVPAPWEESAVGWEPLTEMG